MRLIFFIAGVICVACILWFTGWYPIAYVSGSFFYARDYVSAYDLSYAYYSYMFQNDQTANHDAELQSHLKFAVLEGLIDARLMERKLRSYMSAGDLRGRVNERVDALWSDPVARDALVKKTGASERAIKKFFLRQEILGQLLDTELAREKTDAQSWLFEERERVFGVVFLPTMTWTKNGVQSKSK